MKESLISVSAFFFVTLLVHIAICWIASPGRFLLKGLATGVAGTMALAVFRSTSANSWLLETYVLFSAWIFYMMAFMNLLNSVTLRMLLLLCTAPQLTLEKHSLGGVLNDSNGFDTRFDLMEKNGLIERDGGALRLTRHGQLLAVAVEAARMLLATDMRPDNRKD
jgi:hypothetical protein